MKLNKKGFTLVELLAVLAILMVILLIAIPSITSSLSRTEDKQLQAKKDLITSSVEINVQKSASYYTRLIGQQCSFTVASIKTKGWITDDMSKDSNGNSIAGCVYYNKNNKKYEFKSSGCLTQCS